MRIVSIFGLLLLCCCLAATGQPFGHHHGHNRHPGSERNGFVTNSHRHHDAPEHSSQNSGCRHCWLFMLGFVSVVALHSPWRAFGVIMTIVVALKVALAVLSILGPLAFLFVFLTAVKKCRRLRRINQTIYNGCHKGRTDSDVHPQKRRRCQVRSVPDRGTWSSTTTVPPVSAASGASMAAGVMPVAHAEHCRKVLSWLLRGEIGMLAAPFRTPDDLARPLGVFWQNAGTPEISIGLDDIKTKLDAGAYRTVANFAADVRRIFKYYREFHGPTRASRIASRLEGEFIIMLAELPAAATDHTTQ